jgi:hypothetical protein
LDWVAGFESGKVARVAGSAETWPLAVVEHALVVARLVQVLVRMMSIAVGLEIEAGGRFFDDLDLVGWLI